MQTVQAALVAAFAVVALVVSSPPGAAGNSRSALTISIDGAIGPATAGYVKDALATAAERRAEVVTSWTGPRTKVTSSRKVNAGGARGAEPFSPGEVVEVANIIDLTLVVQRRRALTGEGGAS